MTIHQCDSMEHHGGAIFEKIGDSVRAQTTLWSRVSSYMLNERGLADLRHVVQPQGDERWFNRVG